MATWKRLTRTGSSAEKVDVNLEAISLRPRCFPQKTFC